MEWVVTAALAHVSPSVLGAGALEPAALSLKTFLLSWDLRLDVIAVLALLGAAYGFGWRRLTGKRRRLTRSTLSWQPVCYFLGLATLFVALLSPVDVFDDRSLTLHMVQHLLLIMIAPPLLLLANPFPAVLWALPGRTRRRVGRFLARNSRPRRFLWVVTLPGVAWLVYVITLWTWHLPAAYQWALADGPAHDFEHLSFFAASVLFWWPIINPAPHFHRRPSAVFQILYLVAATAQNTLLGALIATATRLLYPFYAGAAPLWGLTPLQDQALAGGIMWVSGHMYLIPILLVVGRLLGREERGPAYEPRLRSPVR